MLGLELGENDHIGGWLLCRGARSEGMGWRDALGGGFSEHGVNFRSQASVEKRWNHHKKPTEAAGEGGRKNTSRGNRGGKHRISNKHCPSVREGMQLPCDGLMGGIKRGQERNKEGLTARVRRRTFTKGFHA